MMSDKKLRVLAFVSHFYPGFKSGGPAKSITNLASQLRDDVDFSIITRDRDLGDTEPYRTILKNEWNTRPFCKIYYLGPTEQNISRIANLIRATPHDILYLNSTLDVRFTLWPLLARRLALVPRTPLVIASRGEFSSGALALKKKRKWLYFRFCRALGLFDDAIWMASSTHEAADIERALGISDRSIQIAPDLVDARVAELENLAPPSPRDPADPLRLVFLSRISPMKNLHYALTLLKDVKEPVHFDIFGPCSDSDYLQKCQALSETLPAHITAHFRGEVEPQNVISTLARYDLTLLPTRGENFGHIVWESLIAGTPVLLSDRTLWRTTSDAACLAIPLDQPHEFRAAIEQRAKIRPDQQNSLRDAARDHALRFANDPEHIAANLRLFRSAAQNTTITSA